MVIVLVVVVRKHEYKNEDSHNSLELSHVSGRFAPKNGLSAANTLAFRRKANAPRRPRRQKYRERCVHRNRSSHLA